MKTKRVKELPKCDFCDNKAEYDAPTTLGTWANMCSLCFAQKGSIKSIGIKFIEGIAEPKSDGKIKIASTVDLEAAERYVRCPECGEERHVEPDADYEFHCENCGTRLKCVDIMLEI